MAKTPKKSEVEPTITPQEKLTNLAKLLLNLKAKLKKLEEQQAEDSKELRSDIQMVTQLFAEQAHEAGITSVGTTTGNVGISARKFYKSDDIAALREYAMNNDEAALLSMSLSSTGLKEYIERNEGKLPPTVYPVEVEEVYTRPKKAKKALA